MCTLPSQSRLRLLLALLTLMWAGITLAAAEPRDLRVEGSVQGAPQIIIRSGDHPGFGRLVFDLPLGTAYDIETETETDRTVIRFRGRAPLVIGSAPRLPRNVRSIKIVSNQAEIDLT